MTRLFFLSVLCVSAFFALAVFPDISAQENVETPSVLPPGTEESGETTSSEGEPASSPKADSSQENSNAAVPPEKEKSAIASSSPETLELTPEQEEQLHKITQKLFQVPASRSGGGETELVEIPLSLHEAMTAVNGSDRIPAVKSYWRLRSLIANLNVETQIKETAQKALESLQSTGTDSPDFQALIATWQVYVSSCSARTSETRVAIRNAQVDLMRLTRRSIEQGWPIPSSTPWYGNYSLESESAQSRSFELASEAILIPEKIRAAYASGFALGSAEDLFSPEITAFDRLDDGYLFLKTLENKRIAALGYIRILESLNNSIARYVGAYSSTLDSRTFVNCLIGDDEE